MSNPTTSPTTSPRAPILVGVGDTGSPHAALQYAARVALTEHRPLLLAHVVHPEYGLAGPTNPYVDFSAVHLVGEQLVHRAADEARSLVEGRVDVRALTPTGSVVSALVELAGGADRVVLQRRDLSRVRRLFTGSVVTGVAGRSGVPVVSVPEDWTGRDTADARVTPRVVLGDAGELAHPHVVEAAFLAARRLAGSLTVVHAWTLPLVYDDLILDRTEFEAWAMEAGRRLDRRLEPWRERFPDVPLDVEVGHARPGDALLEAVSSADLLVLGREGASHRVPLLGPLTRALVRECPCPLQIVPAGDRVGPGADTRIDEPVQLQV